MNLTQFKTYTIKKSSNPYDVTIAPEYYMSYVGDRLVNTDDIVDVGEAYVSVYSRGKYSACSLPHVSGKKCLGCKVTLKNGSYFYSKLTLQQISDLVGVRSAEESVTREQS